MKYINICFFIFSLIAFASCIPVTSGHFIVHPYAKPFTSKINTPLHIVFTDYIKDTIKVGSDISTPLLLPHRLTSFKSTLKDGLDNTFKENFSIRSWQSTIPTEGLALVIYRIDPYWRMQGSSISSTSERTYSNECYFAVVKYNTSLFWNGKKVHEADGVAESEFQESIRNALKVTCEEINRNIFTHEIVEKIRQKSFE